MLEPEGVLIDLAAVREERATNPDKTKRGAGRPRKSEDAIAKERNADVQFLQDSGFDIRRNLMNGDIEYEHPTQGTLVIEGDDLNVFTHLCAHHLGTTLPEIRMKNALLFTAGLNSYCPVTQYLESCVQTAEPSEHFDGIAARYMGNTEPIANESLKRLMVGMVARIYKPASP